MEHPLSAELGLSAAKCPFSGCSPASAIDRVRDFTNAPPRHGFFAGVCERTAAPFDPRSRASNDRQAGPRSPFFLPTSTQSQHRSLRPESHSTESQPRSHVSNRVLHLNCSPPRFSNHRLAPIQSRPSFFRLRSTFKPVPTALFNPLLLPSQSRSAVSPRRAPS